MSLAKAAQKLLFTNSFETINKYVRGTMSKSAHLLIMWLLFYVAPL